MNTVTVVVAILGITVFLIVSVIGFILLKLVDKANADIAKELSKNDPGHN